MKTVQAKDIPDADVLRHVHLLTVRVGHSWATSQQLEEHLRAFPPKVVRAKCRGLVLRGLMTGCSSPSCVKTPCRGEFALTQVGREAVG